MASPFERSLLVVSLSININAMRGTLQNRDERASLCPVREKIVNEGTCQIPRYGARYEVRARYRYKYNKTACARQVS